MMKLLICNLAVLSLSGCASMATIYDRQDPCQTGQGNAVEQQRLNRPQDYQRPNWCGASLNRTYIYNNQGIRQGYIVR